MLGNQLDIDVRNACAALDRMLQHLAEGTFDVEHAQFFCVVTKAMWLMQALKAAQGLESEPSPSPSPSPSSKVCTQHPQPH